MALSSVTSDARPANTNASPATPLLDALDSVRVNGAGIMCMSRQDAIDALLGQAHALTVILSSALEDAGTISCSRQHESAVGTLRDTIKAQAVSAIGTLIAIASSVSMEGE